MCDINELITEYDNKLDNLNDIFIKNLDSISQLWFDKDSYMFVRCSCGKTHVQDFSFHKDHVGYHRCDCGMWLKMDLEWEHRNIDTWVNPMCGCEILKGFSDEILDSAIELSDFTPVYTQNKTKISHILEKSPFDALCYTIYLARNFRNDEIIIIDDTLEILDTIRLHFSDIFDFNNLEFNLKGKIKIVTSVGFKTVTFKNENSKSVYLLNYTKNETHNEIIEICKKQNIELVRFI